MENNLTEKQYCVLYYYEIPNYVDNVRHYCDWFDTKKERDAFIDKMLSEYKNVHYVKWTEHTITKFDKKTTKCSIERKIINR